MTSSQEPAFTRFEFPKGVDPYQFFSYLRESSPVMRMGDKGPWTVALYDDVHKIIKDHKLFSSEVAIAQGDEQVSPNLLFSDPPVHHRLRKLVSRAFSPEQIGKQREMISQRCEELVLDMVQEQECDLNARLACPLPVSVIAGMLGVDDNDFISFKKWSGLVFGNIGDFLFGTPSKDAAQAGEDMTNYFLGRIAEIRKAPEDNLIGHLIEVETDEGKLTDDELVVFCATLLIAGNETTTGLIIGLFRLFHEQPEMLTRLKQDPDLAPKMVEETLRYYSPFLATVRRVTQDTEISGKKIEKGNLVIPLLASANRDENIFKNADIFIPDREPNPHLAFGFGIHFCLGAVLARLEGEIVLRQVARHVESIEFVDYDPLALSEFVKPEVINIIVKGK